MMVTTKQLLFLLILGLGVSMSAYGQNEKKNPPKSTPPVVTPQPKSPPPKEEPKTKKPSSALIFWRSEDGDIA